MKFKFLFAFMIGGFALGSAQGFNDAVEYYRANQPEEAQIIIERTINNPGTDRSTAVYYLGQILFDQGKKAQAAEKFEEGVSLNAQNALNYVGLGQVALENGNKSAAADYFKQARNLDKKNAELITEIARAYYKVDPVAFAKDIDKYIADARKADKNSPAAYILEADRLAAAGDIGNAAGHYEMAMNTPEGPNHPEAYVKYARTYFPVNAGYAIDGLRRYLDVHPNSALAQRELAEKYYENNQLTRAAEQYGQYIQNPNHFQRDEQRYVGLLYFGKKYQESNDLAAKILNQDPDNFYMKRMRFYNFAAMEDSDNAQKTADTFFAAKGEFTPNDYIVYSDLLGKLGQDTLAARQYEKAVALAPEKPELLKDLSTAYASANMFAEAADAQQRFIDAGTYTTNDLMTLARRYQNAAANEAIGTPERNAHATKALEVINDVYAKVPDNALVTNTRARILLIANDNEMTPALVEEFQKALDLMDSDPANLEKRKSDYIFYYNLLGKYYLDNKDKDNALRYYEKFIEINPENEPLRQFIETLKK